MRIHPGDTFDSFIEREYDGLRRIVGRILAYYGWHVPTHIDNCTQDAALTIERRNLIGRYCHATNPSGKADNYMLSSLRRRVMQCAEKDERTWTSVNPIRMDVEPSDNGDYIGEDEGLYVSSMPDELMSAQCHEPLDIREYLDYVEEAYDERMATWITRRMDGYLDSETEKAMGYSHSTTRKFIPDAQAAYCQYTGMHHEPGRREVIVPPERYTSESGNTNRRRGHNAGERRRRLESACAGD